MKHIHEISEQGFTWVNATRQTESVVAEVRDRFHLRPEDALECLPPFQRPKIVKREGYYFLIFHFPVFDRDSKRLTFTELDIFLAPHFLVTIHENKLPALSDFFSLCANDFERRREFFGGSMAHTFLEMISRVLDAVFPILLHVNQDINSVDRKLFTSTSGREMAEEILRLKSNSVTFRRTMQGHKAVLDRLVMYGDKDLQLVSYQNYLNALREYTQEIWHMLESQHESINALHETNESILSLRTNETMRMLTVISVITFPLTLIATLFAIRAPGTPFVDHPFGFVIIVLLTLAGAGMMVLAFKRKGWL